MSEFEPTPELELHAGIIEETVDRALGIQALISLAELGE